MIKKSAQAQKTRAKKTSGEMLHTRADELLKAIEGLIAELRQAEDEFLRQTAPLLQELTHTTAALERIPDDSDETLKRITAEYEADLDDLTRYLEAGAEPKK